MSRAGHEHLSGLSLAWAIVATQTVDICRNWHICYQRSSLDRFRAVAKMNDGNDRAGENESTVYFLPNPVEVCQNAISGRNSFGTNIDHASEDQF